MANTTVILQEKIYNLGAEADIVSVKRGYARNFLIPQGKAYEANDENRKNLEELQAKRAKREADELIESEKLAGKIKKLKVKLSLTTGYGGKAFGSITPADILSGLKDQHGIDLHKSQLLLKDGIRETGTQEVTLKLHGDLECQLKLDIEADPVKGLRSGEAITEEAPAEEEHSSDDTSAEESPAAEAATSEKEESTAEAVEASE